MGEALLQGLLDAVPFNNEVDDVARSGRIGMVYHADEAGPDPPLARDEQALGHAKNGPANRMFAFGGA